VSESLGIVETELLKLALEVVLDRATRDARDPNGGVDTSWQARPPLGDEVKQQAMNERDVLELAHPTANRDADPAMYAAIVHDQRALSAARLRIDALASHGAPIDFVHEPVTRHAIYAEITFATIVADRPQRLAERRAQRHVTAAGRSRPHALTGVAA
jgi:hypothetical protein